MGNINKAVKKAKSAIEKLYIGSCIVTEYVSYIDEATKMTKHREEIVLENQPCRISFSAINNAVVEDDANSVSQLIKLFIAPDKKINAGSKITVTQNNVTTEYQRAGVPAMYSTHQEIELELFKGWA